MRIASIIYKIKTRQKEFVVLINNGLIKAIDTETTNLNSIKEIIDITNNPVDIGSRYGSWVIGRYDEKSDLVALESYLVQLAKKVD